MDNGLYKWSPLISRPALRWPDRARVAVCVIVTLDHLDWRPPIEGYQPPGLYPRPLPDHTTLSRHAYGNRVGVFRLLEVLDKVGIPVTIAIDATTAENFPYLVDHCIRRKADFIARGLSASWMITSRLPEAEERSHINACLVSLTKSIGTMPKGWFGAQYGESTYTPRLLAASGIEYVCDWVNDEQPYRMESDYGPLHVLPVALDFDDDFAFRQMHYEINWYEQTLRDAFDVLYEDGTRTGRTLVINTTPWLMGQPYRIRAFESALRHIMSHPNVWAAQASKIVEWFKNSEKRPS